MDVLILGAGGMVGHLAAVYFQEEGHNVVGFTQQPVDYCENIVGNALDLDTVKKVVTDGSFNAIINCIGILNKSVDTNLKDGIYLNSYLPHFVVDCIKNKDTKFIHLSTDCVFSGKSGGYKEDSFCDSDSFYGRSKVLGEIIDEKNLTIRTSIIGPDRKECGTGLLNWFLKQTEPVPGFVNAIWTGVSTITLVRAMEAAIQQNLTGLYHLVNNETINKYDLINLFNRYINQDRLILHKDETLVTNKSLVNTRTDFDFCISSYDEMVKETSVWIEMHKQLYPHYDRG
ncbi:MAG: SDR family oxidoreductase [Mobilitalea sp.]